MVWLADEREVRKSTIRSPDFDFAVTARLTGDVHDGHVSRGS
jgi:hypothetical protein